MPNNANFLSDGVKEDTIYALVGGQQKLCEINIKSCSINWRNSLCNYCYNFGCLCDGYLINTGRDDFIVIGCFYRTYTEYYMLGKTRRSRTKNNFDWSAYSYAEDRWVNLVQWEQYQTCRISMFFDPVTYRIFYHINGRETWNSVDLITAKIKDKKPNEERK